MCALCNQPENTSIPSTTMLCSSFRKHDDNDNIQFNNNIFLADCCHLYSISDIRLDTHLGNQSTTSSNNSSNFGSRGALAWTPPASMGGSTPTWTEGTPSFTESSSSENGELKMNFTRWHDSNHMQILIFSLCFISSPQSPELSGSSSPLNHSSMSDKHKPNVEKALNSLTSEMVRVCYTESKSIRISYKSQDL